MKGTVQSPVRVEDSQGTFLEEVMPTSRAGRMGVGHSGKEGRANNMCIDPEVRKGMAD